MHPPSIIITGGGTAGHIFPALAVADALVGIGYDKSQIGFVGSRRGMEGAIVRDAGYAIALLPGRGLARGARVANVRAVLGLLGATVSSVAMFARRRPAVVISVGGYASLASSMAAVAMRIPVVVINVDAVAGRVNRAIARHATASAVGFPGTQLPRSVVTGAPVRTAIELVTRDGRERSASRALLGIPEKSMCITIVGGSLGARRLNELGVALAHAYVTRDDIFIFHVVGARNYAQMRDATESARLGGNYLLVPFTDEVPALLSATDLMVCRSGAMTVAELAVTGVPAILFPLAGAPNDHQRMNAQELARGGGAVVADDEMTDGAFVELVTGLIGDRASLERMGLAARALGRRGAAGVIAGLVDNVVRRKPLDQARGKVG